MKKLLAILLALVLVFTLVACSSAPDRTAAADAYNQAAADYNAAATVINENIQLIDPALVEKCTEIAGLLAEGADKLNSEEELTQENLDEMIGWFTEVSEWSVNTQTEIEDGLAQLEQ